MEIDPQFFTCVIALSGHKAAGKDTLSKVFERFGYQSVRFSDVIREEATLRGIADPTVPQMQDIGNEIRQSSTTQDTMLVRVLDYARARGINKLIVNGNRNPSETETLQQLLGQRCVLVGITAPTPLRAARYLARHQAGDTLTLDAFLAMDDRDRGIGEPPYGQQADRALARVPYEQIYLNIGSEQDMERWAERFYRAYVEPIENA